MSQKEASEFALILYEIGAGKGDEGKARPYLGRYISIFGYCIGLLGVETREW
jgi:hypothetical protein